MNKSLRCLPIAVMLIVAVLAIASPSDDWDKEATRRKADYVFVEAQNAYGTEHYDDYAALIDRAYALDSADLDIAAEWGMVKLSSDRADSVTRIRAYRALRRRFLNNPHNYTTGIVFANVARHMDNYPDVVMTWQILDSIFPTKSDPAEELAKAYVVAYILGDSLAYDKALAIYDRLEAGAGKNIPLSSQKIRAYLLKNDTAAVERELGELLERAPRDSYTALFVGSNYEYLKKAPDAIKYYNLACELDSTNGSAYMARAGFYREQGDSAAFDREVFLALRSQNLEVEPKLEILRSYVSELYTDSAQEGRIRELFGELEQMHAGEPEIHRLYCAYLYEIKDYKGAAEQASYATALNPANESAWVDWVQMQGLARDTEGLVQTARDAMKRFQSNLYFPIAAADMLRQEKRNAEALAVLDSADVSDVQNPDAVSNFLTVKGDVYSVLHDTVSAIETYEKAINLNPSNKMALNNAAYFMAQIGGDLDKAEQYSARVIKSEPDNPTYLDTYAWIFFKKKEYTLARQYIDMTMNLYNTEADTVAVGTDEELELVLPTGPDDFEVVEVEEPEGIPADILEHAGDIYFMNGEPDQALEFWKEAYRKDPDNEMLAKKVKHKTYFFK